MTGITDDDTGTAPDAGGTLKLEAAATPDAYVAMPDEEGGAVRVAGNVLANDVSWYWTHEEVSGRMAGKIVRAQIAVQPEHGSVTLDADGHFEYAAEDGFSGYDTFTYDLYDKYPVEGTSGFLGNAEVTIASLVVLPTIDLELDGLFEQYEEGAEAFAPGAFVLLNNDFSKGVVQLDSQPNPLTGLREPLLDEYGEPIPLADNSAEARSTYDHQPGDLTPAKIVVNRGDYTVPLEVVLTFDDDVQVWNLSDPATNGHPKRLTSGEAFSIDPSWPVQLMIEGLAARGGLGAQSIRAEVRRVGGTVVYSQDTARYTVVDFQAGVDGDRDDAIDFESYRDRQLTFWYNNDRDDAINDYGVPDDSHSAGWSSTDNDGTHAGITSYRDLEDFAAYRVGVQSALAGWISANAGALLLSTEGVRAEYFRQPDAAAGVNAHVTEISTTPLDSFEYYYQEIPDEDDIYYLNRALERGLTVDGRCVVPFLVDFAAPAGETMPEHRVVQLRSRIDLPYAGGQWRTFTRTVTIDLYDIRAFYDRWVVQAPNLRQVNFGSLEESQFHAVNEESNHEVFGRVHGAPFFNGEQNIVFVHGWNLDAEGKASFAQTMYKRLYWEGFQGNFIAFDWPTTVDADYEN